jgi:hypothetical protein
VLWRYNSRGRDAAALALRVAAMLRYAWLRRYEWRYCYLFYFFE